jgi:hypothetical protein
MNKQHDSSTALMSLQNKIDRWNYDKSVEKTRPLVKQWGRATEDLFRELYLAKKFLTRQKGQRKDSTAENYIRYSWDGYCKAIGIPLWAADGFLKKFTPRELSETGRDTLLVDALPKKETTASHALMQARIAEVLRTGNRPADFTDEEEAELKRQEEMARLAEITEKLNVPTYYKANDRFSEALRHSKGITNFKLENPEQTQAQYKVFKYIEAYLDTFKNPEIQALAAFNVALRARNLANEYAERNFQLSESAQAKDEEHDS